MKWKVLFFESARGESPVENFFHKQQLSARTKMLHLFELLEIHGPQLGMPHAKKLDFNIYELRVRGKEEIRILYGMKQKTIYLLHAFKKQTRKTPEKEIETATNRLTEV